MTGIRCRPNIGQGGFAHVSKGKLGGNTVALKALTIMMYVAYINLTTSLIDFGPRRLLSRSIDVAIPLVLPFLGIYQDERMEQFFLVSLYMMNGTFAQWRNKVEGRL